MLLQKETVRVLLDPIARFAPGADGIVDLYLMPAYDDIASLYFVDGQWRLNYVFECSAPLATPKKQAESYPLDKETLNRVLSEMSGHGG